VLNGNNATTGATTLTAGTLVVGSDTAFGTGNVNFAAATLQGDGTARTIANTVSLTGNGTIGGSSDLNFSGPVTQTASRTVTVNNTGQTTFGNINLSASATSYTLTLAGSGDATIAGIIANGGTSTAGRLTKAGRAR
jgi:fibronectin-binding autotransporter adhesin